MDDLRQSPSPTVKLRNSFAAALSDNGEDRSGRTVARGAAYITLDRLVKKGCLTSRMADASEERGGRARRYFAVTESGRGALREAKEALVQAWQGLEGVVER